MTTDAGPGGSGDRPGGLQLCLFAFVSGLLAFVSGYWPNGVFEGPPVGPVAHVKGQVPHVMFMVSFS